MTGSWRPQKSYPQAGARFTHGSASQNLYRFLLSRLGASSFPGAESLGVDSKSGIDSSSGAGLVAAS
jgi:hypothetical protein